MAGFLGLDSTSGQDHNRGMSKRETETEKAERLLVDDDSVFDAIITDLDDPSPRGGDLAEWVRLHLDRFSDETLDEDGVEWDHLVPFFSWGE